MKKLNIAVAGGPCTGKSVLAAHLYSHLKLRGYDYDLIFEECRKLKKEFGGFKDPFERFYMWRQQEREELRSTAENGFITDQPLFHYYAQAKQFASGPRDLLALRELLRMCIELDSADRYQLIVLAKNPEEIKYKTDNSRSAKKSKSREKHKIVCSFVEHMWSDKILYVSGSLEQRTQQVMKKVDDMHGTRVR